MTAAWRRRAERWASARRLMLTTVAELKPVYLVCGDDDAKVDAWRARVRARAEAERGPGGLEGFDARQTPPEQVAAALAELTFDTGTRYLLVDDAGAWKAGQLEPLERALAQPVPDTVLVLVVRGKPLKGLTKIVEAAGGECREYPAPKPWELPKWTAGRARELGLTIDKDAASALVEHRRSQPAGAEPRAGEARPGRAPEDDDHRR